jgi:tetrapyrrole methylase family protein/MazG family protein/ATP diphosphatase
MSVKTRRGEAVARLVEVMQRLLAPDGCPWDREQTLTTLKRYVVEEAFEVCDAIDGLGPDAERTVTAGEAPRAASDPRVEDLQEELGDLLLQVVFQAELAATWGWFTLDQVVDGICAKLVRRHPHVFGDQRVAGSAEVLANWEKLKLAEKRDRGALDGIPRGLPALLYALRMGDKAARVGFDWPDAQGPRAKVSEELQELDQALARESLGEARDEIGDLLFSVVNLCRKLGLDPEDALTRTNRRFASRFRAMEALARDGGRPLDGYTLAELDAFWDKAKLAPEG